MNKIKIGWSEVSLLPGEGRVIDLAGQFYERITSEVESPITVTAFAAECGDSSFVICSCDLGGVGTTLMRDVRAILAAKGDFPTDSLILAAIHSHTSYKFACMSDLFGGASTGLLQRMIPNARYESLEKYEGPELLAGEEARALIAERIADAAYSAWQSRSEGGYAQGFGRAAVGMCRRVCYDDGSAKMWGDTDMANFTELEGGNDSGIELLFTYDTDKKLTGVIANVACPAQVLEHRSFISSDYVGKVKEYLRARLGDHINLLTLISPAGDQCPRDMIRWVEPETPINDPNIERNNPTVRVADPSMFDIKGAKLIGRRIADEITYALEDVGEIITDTDAVHKVFSLDIPLRRVTISEKDAAVEAIREFARETEGRAINFRDSAKMHVHAGTVARYEIQQNVETVPIEIHVIRLGSISIATNPFELFLDYGNRIRARSKASQTFLIQLACGSYGYLPTAKAERGSHYSAYVSSGITGHAGGDLLVRKTLGEINSLFK